ncbi:MAG: PD-(D/E)XK nuclease family protein, partial [Acidimicrobiia bacterium]
MRFPDESSALEEPIPKVAPWLLSAADTLCARRLHSEFTCVPGTKDPFNRGRLREVLIDAVRTLHATGSIPPTPSHLEPEEQRVLEHALSWYPRLFEGIADATVESPIAEPTELPRRGVRLGGWVDLCVVSAAGGRELRQLAFGARGAPESPLDLPAIRLAVLRLAQMHWVEDETLTVVWADVLRGARRETSVRVPDDLAPIATWLDERLEVVTSRMDESAAEPGRDCTTCGFVPRCPAHELRGSMTSRKADRFPSILVLSPTSLDAWRRCRRELGNRALSIPPSDPEGGTAHGLYLHDILRFVHQQGSCRDEQHVAEILAMHGADERVADEIRRHVTKCPIDAESVGHEVEWVRTNPKPPVFLASARLDAVWRRDDVLEIRDYKTGQRAVEMTADDPRARLQGWVAAPRAAALGLRLRVRYEHLSREVDEDPEPWALDEHDLAHVDEELPTLVSEMRAARELHG